MFELNNLALFVPSPLQRWLGLLGQLPPAEQEAAYSAAGAGVAHQAALRLQCGHLCGWDVPLHGRCVPWGGAQC